MANSKLEPRDPPTQFPTRESMTDDDKNAWLRLAGLLLILALFVACCMNYQICRITFYFSFFLMGWEVWKLKWERFERIGRAILNK
jgi:hypothetical protein